MFYCVRTPVTSLRYNPLGSAYNGAHPYSQPQGLWGFSYATVPALQLTLYAE